jgi:glutamate-1-semialdehyde 2,1-aminomutase
MNFTQSNSLLDRALKVIPNGTQTFSKSRTHYPVGYSPLYAEKAEGAYIWDVDGNKYLDTISSLGAILLGYHHPEVDHAVAEQISNGSLYSLANELEIQVAEQLRRIIPCAEMCRFSKNGSDVTSAAVAMARHITKRDHILCCGYHGVGDWYVGTTSRNGGVPEAIRNLTHKFEYNNLDSVHKIFNEYSGQVACIIMEPIIDEWPQDGFLNEVRELAKTENALFIFDEMITGFRFNQLSAQKYFGILPDLACFGKAMGNGYPISALVGKAEYMERINEIHFSGTFGGDCIGLAAARETISHVEYSDYQGQSYLTRIGYLIKNSLQSICDKYNIRILGYPERPILRFFNDNDKWKLFQELLKKRILWNTGGFINLTYFYGEKEIIKLLDALLNIIPTLDKVELEFKPMDPIFKIR